MNLKNWKLNALIVGSLVLMTAVFAPVAQADDHRLVIRVSEAFEVNGQTYDAGKLTLQQKGSYSPGATLNEIWVGKECLGVLLAQEVNAPAGLSDSDSFVFTRNAEGTLVLIGVTFRGEPARELYQYSTAADGRWMRPGEPAPAAPGTLLASK